MAASAIATHDTDARSLVPLPAQIPDMVWQDTANLIVQHYNARLPEGYYGPPSFLQDANLVAHLLACVDDGLSPTQAVNALGINHSTYTRWGQRAEAEPDGAHALLFTALKTAQDRRRRRLLSTIGKASEHGPQHWTAAAWLLERGFGNDYKLAQDKTGGGVTIQIGIKAEDLKLAIASNSSV